MAYFLSCISRLHKVRYIAARTYYIPTTELRTYISTHDETNNISAIFVFYNRFSCQCLYTCCDVVVMSLVQAVKVERVGQFAMAYIAYVSCCGCVCEAMYKIVPSTAMK
jgi:hypothetical protein